MTEDRLLYNIPDACEQLGGISRANFYNLVNAGRLRPVKIGRRSYLTVEEIRRFAATLSNGRTAA